VAAVETNGRDPAVSMDLKIKKDGLFGPTQDSNSGLKDCVAKDQTTELLNLI
jgi:hypothetical protein